MKVFIVLKSSTTEDTEDTEELGCELVMVIASGGIYLGLGSQDVMRFVWTTGLHARSLPPPEKRLRSG